MNIGELGKKYRNTIFRDIYDGWIGLDESEGIIDSYEAGGMPYIDRNDIVCCAKDMTQCFDSEYNDIFKKSLITYNDESLLAIIFASVGLDRPFYEKINHKYNYSQIIHIATALEDRVPLELVNSPYLDSCDIDQIANAYFYGINIATLNAFHVEYRHYSMIVGWLHGYCTASEILPILKRYNMLDVRPADLLISDPSDK